MKQRLCAMILLLSLLSTLLAGCDRTPTATESTAPAPETESASPAPAKESTAPVVDAAEPEPPVEANPDLPTVSWAEAFRSKEVPEGAVSSDLIAFLYLGGGGTMQVRNVPKEEIYSKQPERLPRTHFFEQYMPQELIEELLPALDYAITNGYSRLCIPATAVTYRMVKQSTRYLEYTYDFNSPNRVEAQIIKKFPWEDDEVCFLLITVGGMEMGGNIDLFREGLEAAENIVESMPDGLNEQGKVLYLYRYLAENVQYYPGNYDSPDHCFLYDALVLHSTVSSGYAEAFYVLCNLAGIDCLDVSGEVESLTISYGVYAWNVARVNGQYYQFDPTWDRGLSPAEYEYFGMSSEYAMRYHTRLMRSFDTEFCPDCPEDLLPKRSVRLWNSQTHMINWYYRFCNARDCNPQLIFESFGIRVIFEFEDAVVQFSEPRDGWVTATFPFEQFQNILRVFMTEQQRTIYEADSFRADSSGNVMYRVPTKDVSFRRLVGLEENADGTWTASVFELSPDGNFKARKDRVTMEQDGTVWRVAGVETNVE